MVECFCPNGSAIIPRWATIQNSLLGPNLGVAPKRSTGSGADAHWAYFFLYIGFFPIFLLAVCWNPKFQLLRTQETVPDHSFFVSFFPGCWKPILGPKRWSWTDVRLHLGVSVRLCVFLDVPEKEKTGARQCFVRLGHDKHTPPQFFHTCIPITHTSSTFHFTKA